MAVNREQRAWRSWLFAVAAALLLAIIPYAYMVSQGWKTASVGYNLLALIGLWVLVVWGYRRFRERSAARWILGLLVFSTLVNIIAEIAVFLEYPAVQIAAHGALLLLLAYLGGVALLRFILRPGIPIVGVARTFVDEAIRMKVGLIFVLALVVTIPVLFAVMDPDERLEYRVRMFLSWGVGGISLLLSVMTIFLACSTICFEVSEKQIFLTMTKPVSRHQYLLGKWLGLASLNLLMLTISGIGIYAFTTALAQQNARSPEDQMRVYEHILVARNSVEPVPPPAMNFGAALDQEMEQRRSTLDPGDSWTDEERAAVRDEVQQQIIGKWYTVPPRGSQEFRFMGLNAAREYTDQVVLRLEPKTGGSPENEQIRLTFFINDRPLYMDPWGRPLSRPLAINRVSNIPMPLDMATDDGVMDIRIQHINRQNPDATHDSSVSFERGEGLMLLYRTGSFGGNLVRALAVVWMRLLFLGTLGLAAGTFLGFPIACMLAVMVYIVAVTNSYLAESMEFYTAFQTRDLGTWDAILWYPTEFFSRIGDGKVVDAFKMIIRGLGTSFVNIIPSFVDTNPVPYVADGLTVRWAMVQSAFLRIGLGYSLLVGIIGWLIWRRRELAKITV